MKTILLIILILSVTAGTIIANATDDQYIQERQRMVEKQIKNRGITDEPLIQALLRVPRHLFVPENLKDQAYLDSPLPIGYGQTISLPYIVALMTEKLDIKEGDKVLEVGTGSGYQAAVLADMNCLVFSVEIIKILADAARERLALLGYTQVKVKWGDGYFGWEEEAPFDAIIVTCSIDHVPPPLTKQLREGGQMVIPVGPPYSMQTLWLFTKQNERLISENLGEVVFVPLVREVREE